MALAGSRPVDVCLQTIYGLNSGVFLSTLLHCLILTGAWFGALSRVCLHAYYPIYCFFFYPPRICASVCGLSAYHRKVDCLSRPRGCESDYESAYRLADALAVARRPPVLLIPVSLPGKLVV